VPDHVFYSKVFEHKAAAANDQGRQPIASQGERKSGKDHAAILFRPMFSAFPIFLTVIQ
jgi:hypothetical protein